MVLVSLLPPECVAGSIQPDGGQPFGEVVTACVALQRCRELLRYDRSGQPPAFDAVRRAGGP